MSDSIFSSQKSTLPCPTCGEMIYSDASQCRFCSAPIDQATAAAGAAFQKKVNDACNLAKVTRHMATAMWIFFLAGIVIGFARFGTIVLWVGVPISLIVWVLRYSTLKTADPDYKRARRDVLIALIIWLPMCVLQLVVIGISLLGL